MQSRGLLKRLGNALKRRSLMHAARELRIYLVCCVCMCVRERETERERERPLEGQRRYCSLLRLEALSIIL